MDLLINQKAKEYVSPEVWGDTYYINQCGDWKNEDMEKAFADGYKSCLNDFKWHRFPQEIPEDFEVVLTVAENPVTKDKYYHTFRFTEYETFNLFRKKRHELSLCFNGWYADRHFPVIAWTKIPEYKE